MSFDGIPSDAILERYIYLDYYTPEYKILLPKQLKYIVTKEGEINDPDPFIVAIYISNNRIRETLYKTEYEYRFDGVRIEFLPRDEKIAKLTNDFKKKIIQTQFKEGHWCASSNSFKEWSMSNCKLCSKTDYLK